MSCESWKADGKPYIYPECISCVHRCEYPDCPELMKGANKVVGVEIRCPRCGAKASIVSDDRGLYGWCPKERRVFSIKLV